MSRIEKIIIAALVLVCVGLVGFIVRSWTSQSQVAHAPTPNRTVVAEASDAAERSASKQMAAAAAPTPLLPPPIGKTERIEGACMSVARGLVPAGTKVNGMSVAYKHSVDTSGRQHRIVSNLSDINFYTVTVQAEIEGRRFNSNFTCRQWGEAIEIMRR